MSIIAPASSRWSLAGRRERAPLAEDVVLVGGGRVGRVRQRRLRAGASSSSSRVSSGSSSFTRALTACIAAIASDASAPVRLASPIAFAPALRSACAASQLGTDARSAAHAAANAARSRSSLTVIAARKRSQHRLRIAADRAQVEHRDGLLGGRAVGRIAAAASGLEYFARNSATCLASSPVMMFCGIGPDENPPLRMAYSAQFTETWRWSKFGPSLYSRVRMFVVEPCVPATLSVWQPEQRSLKSSAAADARPTRRRFPPHRTRRALPAVAARRLAISSARRDLVIGCDSIGERCVCGLLPPSRSSRSRSPSPAAASAGAPVRERGDELHRHARRLPDPPAGAARAQGQAAHHHRHQPRPARPHAAHPRRDEEHPRLHRDPARASPRRASSAPARAPTRCIACWRTTRSSACTAS